MTEVGRHREQVVDSFVASVPEMHHERARAAARKMTAYKVAELQDHLEELFGPFLTRLGRYALRGFARYSR